KARAFRTRSFGASAVRGWPIMSLGLAVRRWRGGDGAGDARGGAAHQRALSFQLEFHSPLTYQRWPSASNAWGKAPYSTPSAFSNATANGAPLDTSERTARTPRSPYRSMTRSTACRDSRYA